MEEDKKKGRHRCLKPYRLPLPKKYKLVFRNKFSFEYLTCAFPFKLLNLSVLPNHMFMNSIKFLQSLFLLLTTYAVSPFNYCSTLSVSHAKKQMASPSMKQAVGHTARKCQFLKFDRYPSVWLHLCIIIC